MPTVSAIPTLSAGLLAVLAPAAVASEPWDLTVKGGLALFTTSRSLAPEHMTEPTLRLEAVRPLTRRFELGAEVLGASVGDESYRLLAALVVVRSPLYLGPVFSLRLGFGTGLGTGPPILSKDLVAKSAIAPWAQLGLSLRWALGDRAAVGVELLSEEISIVDLLVSFTWRLGPPEVSP